MRFYVVAQYRILIVMLVAVLVVTTLAMVLMTLAGRAGELETDPVGGKMMCRNCKAKAVHLSFKAGPVDFFWSLFSFAPYRCDICYHRFHARRQ